MTKWNYYNNEMNKIFYKIGDKHNLSFEELEKEIKHIKSKPYYSKLPDKYKVVMAYYYYYIEEDGEQDVYYVAQWKDNGELISKRKRCYAKNNFIIDIGNFYNDGIFYDVRKDNDNDNS